MYSEIQYVQKETENYCHGGASLFNPGVLVISLEIQYVETDMNQEVIDRLERSNYFSFATLKKSGEYVATPVWFAPHEGSYYLFSARDAGKIKRLRNFTQCRVATCTASGTVTGEWLDARAQLLEQPEDRIVALAALRQKYGWQMKITDCLSNLSGKMTRRIYIRVDLEN